MDIYEENYNKQIKELDDLEAKSNQAYYDFKRKFTELLSQYSNETSYLITIDNDINYSNHKEILTSKQELIFNLNNKLFNQLYEVLNDFEASSLNTYNNENEIIENSNSNIVTKINEEYSQLTNTLSNRMRKERNRCIKRLAN